MMTLDKDRRTGQEEPEAKMLNQRGFWISSSALVLVLAVMGSGWVFYQAKEFPGVKKLTTSDSITTPPFDISYMRADLYLNAHKDGYDSTSSTCLLSSIIQTTWAIWIWGCIGTSLPSKFS